MRPFKTIAGDSKPIRAELSKQAADGTWGVYPAAELSGATVRFSLRTADGRVLLGDKLGSVVQADASKAVVECPVAAGELVEVGLHRGQWKITKASGEVESIPSDVWFPVLVSADL